MKTELCKKLEKPGFQPRRELMNITSNLHVTIADLEELRRWSDEELQRILSSYQYKPTKVKLTCLGMYTARQKDYCAGYECVVKEVNKLRKNLKLPTGGGDPLHMTVCYITEKSYFKIFEPKLESEEQQY